VRRSSRSFDGRRLFEGLAILYLQDNIQTPPYATSRYNAAAEMIGTSGWVSHMGILLQILVGAVIGILVGITGTGGAFVIPALMYVFRMDQLRAQGTALMISCVPIWIIAFMPYARSHQFDFRLGVLIAIGICIGSYFGANWAQHLPLPVLRRVLGSVLVLIGVRFLYQG
jgi:uncharacterized protein